VAAVGMWLLARWKLRKEAARKKEIKRRMALAAAETARAEFEAAVGFGTDEPIIEPPTSSASSSDSGSHPVRQQSLHRCVVCSNPTSTRCKQCKAVRYCSSKCQIINWRQGHKDECLSLLSQRKAAGLEGLGSEEEAERLSYEQYLWSDSAPGGFKDGDGVGEHILDAKIKFGSSRNIPAASNVSLDSIAASGDKFKDISRMGIPIGSMVKPRSSEQLRPGNDPSENFSDEKSESSNSSLCSLVAGSEDHSLSEPSTPSHGFWEESVEHVDSKMDAVDEFGDQNRSSNISSSRETGLYEKFSGSDSNRGIILELCKNDSRSELSSRNIQKSGPSDCEDRSRRKNTVIHSGIENKKKDGNDPLKLKKSESYGSTSSGSVNLSDLDVKSLENEWARKDSTHLFDQRGCSATNTIRINPFNRRVVDHLEAPRGVMSRYEGLFSYEQFVKLYNWNGIELCPRGLINCGNSCYANAVLQCLAFTPPLTAYFLQGLHSKACQQKDWCFSCEYEALVIKVNAAKFPISPERIMSEVDRIGRHLVIGREEDAHEFLRYAIDSMQSVCLKEAGVKVPKPVDEETTLLGFTFGGHIRSKIECMRCGGKSEQHERMMDLAVEIVGEVATLEDALNRFTRSEILDGENKYLCGRCKSYEKAKKKLKVMEAPNILTIVLKRFQDRKYGKINKGLKFPAILNMAPYMSGTTDKSPVYQLYGVVVHVDFVTNNASSSSSSSSGHYISYVKNNQGRWFEANDTMVEEVRLEKALSRDAYMLFYARCSPRAPRSI
ncbi:hypothetical protein M569_06073, partial [Genlisea aurea]